MGRPKKTEVSPKSNSAFPAEGFKKKKSVKDKVVKNKYQRIPNVIRVTIPKPEKKVPNQNGVLLLMNQKSTQLNTMPNLKREQDILLANEVIQLALPKKNKKQTTDASAEVKVKIKKKKLNVDATKQKPTKEKKINKDSVKKPKTIKKTKDTEVPVVKDGVVKPKRKYQKKSKVSPEILPESSPRSSDDFEIKKKVPEQPSIKIKVRKRKSDPLTTIKENVMWELTPQNVQNKEKTFTKKPIPVIDKILKVRLEDCSHLLKKYNIEVPKTDPLDFSITTSDSESGVNSDKSPNETVSSPNSLSSVTKDFLDISSTTSATSKSSTSDSIDVSSLPLSSPSTNSDSENNPKKTALQILKHKLNCIDMEFINWLGDRTKKIDVRNVKCEALNEEIDALNKIPILRWKLSVKINSAKNTAENSPVSDTNVNIKNVTNLPTVKTIENILCSKTFENDSCSRTIENNLSSRIVENDLSSKTIENNLCADSVANNLNSKIVENNSKTTDEDDDDALSIFAESITLDSCINESNNFDTDPIDGSLPKPRVEKKTADSTCLEKKKIRLISSMYYPRPGVKSTIFRGVCFFNLVAKCEKPRCYFEHKPVPLPEVKIRMERLHESVFIQEYLLVKQYPPLRRAYILTYIEEASRRDLTHLLLEMILDCSTESIEVQTSVQETTLLNLNVKNLSYYTDLLKLNYPQTEFFLGEILLRSLSYTNDIVRFIPIFKKLVEFLVAHDRKFSTNIVVNIVDKIRVLPSIPSLNHSVILLIKNTDGTVFESDIIKYFENSLYENDKESYKELLEIKQNVIVNMVPVYAQAQMKDSRYTSPDTTDNYNQVMQPLNIMAVTRTINNNEMITPINPGYIRKPKLLHYDIKRNICNKLEDLRRRGVLFSSSESPM